jgi:hypothetical protein
MGWRETCAMDERMRFVMSCAAGKESFSALCRGVRSEPEDRLRVACAVPGLRCRRARGPRAAAADLPLSPLATPLGRSAA